MFTLTLLSGLAASAHASFIPPPTLLAACDGYTISLNCVTGTVVYFVPQPPYGLTPLTQMLRVTPDEVWERPTPYTPPVYLSGALTYTPTDDLPEAPPLTSAAPEPRLVWFWGLAGVAAAVSGVRRKLWKSL